MGANSLWKRSTAYALTCRCVHNRQPVDDNGFCTGCRQVRDEAWYWQTIEELKRARESARAKWQQADKR